MIHDLNIFAIVVRSLTLDERTYDVNVTTAPTFICSLQPPRSSKGDDGSPRDKEPYTIRWRAGLLGPVPVPEAGWRLSLTRPLASRSYENTVYELLEDPRESRTGPITQGMEVPAIAVSDLYPYGATLKEQDGTAVGPVGVALWSEREGHRDTGTYEEFSGEAPVEFAGELGNNRWLDLDGERYRIVSSITDFEGPRVKFEARRSNA